MRPLLIGPRLASTPEFQIRASRLAREWFLSVSLNNSSSRTPETISVIPECVIAKPVRFATEQKGGVLARTLGTGTHSSMSVCCASCEVTTVFGALNRRRCVV